MAIHKKKRLAFCFFDKLLSAVCWLGGLGGIFLLIQVFGFTSFAIPSLSMAPALLPGDYILVNKMIPGPRLFDLSASMRGEQVKIYRLPGVRKIQRDDIVVFHFPHPYTWEKLEMHILKYYVKRCVGLPGDTIGIGKGFYYVNGKRAALGNENAQARLACKSKEEIASDVYRAFPQDSVLNWNIQDFGPLYIPKAGDTVRLDQTSYLVYKQAIEWEQKDILVHSDSVFLLHRRPLTSYCFRKNYYFMAGDEVENSQDSRYWGLLPEDFIVGKAWIIWKSRNKFNKEFRWERFFKLVN